MTDDRINIIFKQHGQYVTPRDYALIHSIAEAVAPQRTWVGLTAGERDELTCGVVKGWVIEHLAIAIEAKLKEKNSIKE